MLLFFLRSPVLESWVNIADTFVERLWVWQIFFSSFHSSMTHFPSSTFIYVS